MYQFFCFCFVKIFFVGVVSNFYLEKKSLYPVGQHKQNFWNDVQWKVLTTKIPHIIQVQQIQVFVNDYTVFVSLSTKTPLISLISLSLSLACSLANIEDWLDWCHMHALTLGITKSHGRAFGRESGPPRPWVINVRKRRRRKLVWRDKTWDWSTYSTE